MTRKILLIGWSLIAAAYISQPLPAQAHRYTPPDHGGPGQSWPTGSR